ncbi:MAG: hypothetical protein NTV21_05030 [Planctomycetota bacterium]|nr:hypothetical protein [Planctomycetota bacterium]
MKIASLTALAACIAMTSCLSTSRQPGDQDSMMASLSPAQRVLIDEARSEHDRRTDELALARRDVTRAQAERAQAKTDLVAAEQRVDQAEAKVAVAVTGTTEDLETAREGVRVAKAKVVPQHDMIRWRDCNLTRCEKAETLAQRSQDLAAARVDLEKERAFAKSDRADARNTDVSKYETLVNDLRTRESVARVELEGAVRQCTLAEQNYDAAVTTSKKN